MQTSKLKYISFKHVLNILYMNIPKNHKVTLKLSYFNLKRILKHILNYKKLKTVKNPAKKVNLKNNYKKLYYEL